MTALVRIDSLVDSDYRRARETAEDIGRLLGKEPVPDTLIHECSPSSDRAGYIMSLVLPTPERLLERCDIDLSGAVSPGEFQSSLCMSTCEEQRMYFGSVC